MIQYFEQQDNKLISALKEEIDWRSVQYKKQII